MIFLVYKGIRYIRDFCNIVLGEVVRGRIWYYNVVFVMYYVIYVWYDIDYINKVIVYFDRKLLVINLKTYKYKFFGFRVF